MYLSRLRFESVSLQVIGSAIDRVLICMRADTEIDLQGKY